MVNHHSLEILNVIQSLAATCGCNGLLSVRNSRKVLIA